jgi:hypothetical protein
MAKTVPTTGHGTHPPGSEKTYNTRANTRASSLAIPQKQHQLHRESIATATTPQSMHEPGEESQGERHINDRKEILYAVAGRLDEILEKCKTFEHYKKNVTSLAKFARKAADCDQGTIVQLTLADMKAAQDEIKADLTSWCDTIECKLDTLDKKQNKILESTASIGERTEGLRAAAKEIESHVGKVTNATDKLANSAMPYRDALMGGIGRTGGEAAIDGRIQLDAERKAKQILIDFKDNNAAMTSTEALIDKANEIIASIDDNDRPDVAKVEAMTRFLKGGVLLHLNSREAARWLREPGVEEVFLQKFASNATVRERLHHVLFQGVPITFDPGNEEHLREVEEANGLLKYSLVKARWIKPEGRRRKGQTHAHATAAIGMAETANRIIRDGVHICGIDIRPEKLRQEPLQCLRCRRWGHFAINCLESQDACGTCGENHRTNQCTNPDKRHCVSCNVDTHASWDRACPEFLRRSKLYDEKHPENNTVYFPTEEDWTLTTRPSRIPVEERFPQRYAVNSLPVTNKRAAVKGKKTINAKPTMAKMAQGKEQHTINHYFGSSQAKGKGKETMPEEGELQDMDEYEEGFENAENNDVESLIGRFSF